ncbi:MAG: hypothetical protein K6G70_04605 [Bacteroidaceae bacterium]|nr:hypothetical protein [Bacteroidaceae bacterium]
MMKKNIFAIILLALTIGFGFTSCEDMLTGDMDRNVGIEEVAADTLYSYWGIQRSLQKIAERYVILGECRGDLVDGSAQYTKDSIRSILEFTAEEGSSKFLQAKDFYHVINSCNAYIQRCDTLAVSGLNRRLMLSEYSQVVSIRAWAYLQLVLTYGRVPYFEKPMLSTADMEDFRKAATYVDANTLATSGVVQKVDEVRHYGSQIAGDSLRVITYPSYGTYGYKEVIVDASMCIFPQDLVLGDIWLLKAQGQGSESDYRKAAEYYYGFLNSEKGGPMRANSRYVLLRKMEETQQYYASIDAWIGMFYNNHNKTSQTEEIVTVIPCSKNKLYGEVFSEMNELFGFEMTQRVSADSTSTGSINLEPNFQHQLDASQAYIDLNKAQDYEVYIGTGSDAVCTTYAKAGDARFYSATDTYTDYKTGGTDQQRFVVKQNPLGNYTTTYPVIYRKANVWLRFAEALNGAGFPGYAFAILRHGLIGTDGWVPTAETQYAPADKVYTYKGLTFNGKSLQYWDKTEIDNTGEEPDTTFYDNLPEFRYHLYQRAISESTVFTTPIDDTVEDPYLLFMQTEANGSTDPDNYPAEATFITELDTYINGIQADLGQRVTAYANNIDAGSSSVVCSYISKDEMKKAKSTRFLNFATPYLQLPSNATNNRWQYLSGTTEYRMSTVTENFNNGAVTQGIHARGCGFLKLLEYDNSYSYVKQINKMRQKYEGATTDLTEQEIYDPTNLRLVQEAIADLLIDELALETSFEGNRFFDLLCYSRMLGGAKGIERFARKVASRSGTLDATLYSRLQDQNNWYVKIQ